MNKSFWGIIRTSHKWIAILLAIPVIIVIITGVILQLRKPVDFIQPNIHYGVARYQPIASLEAILESVKAEPKMKVSGWQDIQIYDLRPKAGVIKVRTYAEMEAQVDAKTAEVLNVQQRYNDILTLMHEGSTWGMRRNVFLIAGVLMLILTVVGCFLIYQVAKGKISSSQKRARRIAEMNAKGAAELAAKPAARFNLMKFCRKYHFYLAIIVALPWLLVSISGLMLQVRYEVPWIMPERIQTTAKVPVIEFTEIFEKVKKIKGIEASGWKDIWRVYVYPKDGNISVRMKNLWEVQFNAETGDLLDLSIRRTDFIEDVHEGKWLKANFWLFLPIHVLSIFLWLIGVYLWFKSSWPRRKKA